MNIATFPAFRGRPTAFATLAGALCLSTALVRPAAAANPSPSPYVTPYEIQPVIVVAQRRNQNAQKVGISISTVSGKRLAEDGVTKVNGLQYEVPNLEITQQFGTGQPSFAIRGVGTDFNDYASNNAPVVGYYIDDVAYPIPAMTQGQLFDIQRVEVLRGPQGTLFGRNTTAGAINVITNKPTDHLTYGGSLEYGSYNNAILEGYVSGPITDNLRFRLAGQTNQGGGWQYNRVTDQSFGNNNTKNLRGEIEWDATPDLTFLLNAHWDRDQGDGEASSLLDPRGIFPADSSPRAVGWGTTPAFANYLGITPDQKPYRNDQGYGFDLTTNYRLPFARITSITSVERLDRHEYDALDGTNYGAADVYFGTHAGAYAEDLRIQSLTADPLNWLVGAYFSRENLSDNYDSGFSELIPGGIFAHTSYSQWVETKSLYAHGEYEFLPKLKLVLGGRIENEQRKINNFSTQGFSEATDGEIVGYPAASQSTSYTLPSWKVELDYQLLPQTMLYASVTAGVKSGGFTAINATVPAALAISPFKPERLLAYEVGAKNEFLDNTLLVNADAFYYDYRDQQVLGVIVDPTYGAIGHFVNAPKSHLYGAEGELDWLPLPGLSIDQSLGFTAGAFDEFTDTVGATATNTPITENLAGHGIGAPRYTYALDASETLPLNEDYSLRFGGRFTYRDQYVSLLDTSTNSFNIKPYGLLDVDIALLPTHHDWTLSIWGRNVLNRKYLVSNNYFDSSIYAVGVYGEPASYGLRLTYDFK